ncbi:MAG TPA: PEP-utilizing enzyme, partial [Chloroflexota bacterium]|nr:PEP-utilizing enzyme [Chloroflexota bacterium]
LNRRLLEIHRWSLTHAEILYSLLRRLAARIYGPDRAAAFAAEVVQNLDDQSMHLNRALGHLARSGEGLDTPAFQAQFRAFLAAYGHRSFSLDLLRPNFAADPGQVINLVAALRSAPPNPAAESVGSLPEKSRLRASILWPLAYLTRRYARLREDQRFAWQRGMAHLRRLYLLAGRHLARRGVIRREEDVFFLIDAEIRNQVNHPNGSLAERVEARARRFTADSAHFAANPRESYPPFLRGSQPLVQAGEQTAAPRALRGVAVSPGVGRGRVRVISRADDLAGVRPGEILVTRGADPAWTIVFGELAGLITESGGQLSHAAVAAREYHLPAVLGVPRATEVIRTGDEVLVDGTAGQIVILGRG